MIKAALIVCFVAVSFAAPAPEEIISYDAVDHKHEQKGQAGVAVKGSYSYTDAEGKIFTINYVADDNGYRAEGSHLPIAPEVPVDAEPVPEPAADPADEPVPEPAAEPAAETPAPEAPVAVAKAVETPASTATFVSTPLVAYPYATFPYAAYPYAAHPYSATIFPSSKALSGYSYGYTYGALAPFYG